MGPRAINASTDNDHKKAWYVEGALIPFRYGINSSRFVRFILVYDEVDANNAATFTPFRRAASPCVQNTSPSPIHACEPRGNATRHTDSIPRALSRKTTKRF